MGRNRRVFRILLTFIGLNACATQEEEGKSAEDIVCTINITSGCTYGCSKAETSEEYSIRDLNLLVFENGFLYENIRVQEADAPGYSLSVSLLKGHVYSFFATANFGEDIYLNRWEDIQDLYYEMKDNSGFSGGIPMTASAEDLMIDGQKEIGLELIRMAAEINISLNRGMLSKEVEMEVRKIRIGNFPKYCSVTGKNKVANSYDCFRKGFEMDEQKCIPLNIKGKGGLSDEVSMYLLENMQGNFPYDIGEDEEKVFDHDDPMADRCSYVELEIFYRSDDMISYDSNLIYRFYLGGGLGDLDVQRNCRYSITVTPEDDGLSGNGWRVDNSGIGPSVPYFEILPGDYIEGCVGDEIHISCVFYPRSAAFEIGYDELNYDKSKGLYDYAVDGDGYGVTLFLKNTGTGLVRMSAGDPVNMSGTVIIKVDP